MAHSVVENALYFIESELIPDIHNQLFNLTTRVKFANSQDSFNISKDQKSQVLLSGKSGGCGNRET
jgi:hypothetical protein